MLRIQAGTTGKYCDGVSRRSFLQVGVAGMAWAGLADVLRAKNASTAAGIKGKDTSVILLWLDGGRPRPAQRHQFKPFQCIK